MARDSLQLWLDQFDGARCPSRGTLPVESVEVSLGCVEVYGERLGIGDPWAIPSSAVTVNTGPGAYDLTATCLSYATDGRVAAVRAVRSGATPRRAELVDRFGVDAASACVFDFDRLHAFAARDPAGHGRWSSLLVGMLSRSSRQCGRFACNAAETTIAYFPSGFGDGSYEVRAVCDEKGAVVGAEAVFVEEGAPYVIGSAAARVSATSDEFRFSLFRQITETVFGPLVYRPDKEYLLGFELAFLSAASADSLAAILRREGFECEVQPQRDGTVCCQAVKALQIDRARLNALGARLSHLADEHDGELRHAGELRRVSDPTPLTNEIQLLCERDDVDGALGLLQPRAELLPPSMWAALAWRDLAAALIRKHRYSEALTAIGQARSANSYDPDLAAALGDMLFDLGKHDEAATAWEESLRIPPRYPFSSRELAVRTANYGLARIHAEKGHPDQAMECLRLALKGQRLLRQKARIDPSLQPLRDEKGFRKLVGQ